MNTHDHDSPERLCAPVDPIRAEINTAKWSKKAMKCLEECDRIIPYYNKADSDVHRISLSARQYKLLSEAINKTGQNIECSEYRGYRLKRAYDIT